MNTMIIMALQYSQYIADGVMQIRVWWYYVCLDFFWFYLYSCFCIYYNFQQYVMYEFYIAICFMK